MDISVVSVAMQLSGVDANYFINGDNRVRWLYEESARKLNSSSPALSTYSTTSTASSSGFNSWGSDLQAPKDDTPTTVDANIQTNNKTENKDISIMYNGRDILDLNANLQNSIGTFTRYSHLLRGSDVYFYNRSQYSRFNQDDVPPCLLITCHNDECKFPIPFY